MRRSIEDILNNKYSEDYEEERRRKEEQDAEWYRQQLQKFREEQAAQGTRQPAANPIEPPRTDPEKGQICGTSWTRPCKEPFCPEQLDTMYPVSQKCYHSAMRHPQRVLKLQEKIRSKKGCAKWPHPCKKSWNACRKRKWNGTGRRRRKETPLAMKVMTGM